MQGVLEFGKRKGGRKVVETSVGIRREGEGQAWVGMQLGRQPGCPALSIRRHCGTKGEAHVPWN